MGNHVPYFKKGFPVWESLFYIFEPRSKPRHKPMPNKTSRCLALLVSVLLSCRHDNVREQPDTLFELLPATQTGVDFENTLKPDFNNNIFEYDYFYNGGGVAAADFDNDGRTDLFFSGNQTPGKLYLNQGDFKFADQTAQAGIATRGWCTGVSVADVNQDGWPDIYLCHAGLEHSPNQLFINSGKQADGKTRFSEQAKQYGLDYQGFSTQAAFFDYDKDGDLDMYLLNHFHEKKNPNYPKDKVLDGSSPSNDKLFKNNGNDTFSEVSKTSGITTEGFGLGIAIADLNRDGWPDIYVANDFAYDDLIYINNRNGTFTENANRYLRHTSRFSMGCDIADFNNDLLPDIFVADMLPDDNQRQKTMSIGVTNDVFEFSLRQGYLPQYSRNTLQLNNGVMPDGQMSFSEIGQLAGVYKTDWSWSALFADADDDGWKDLFVSNGIPKDITNLDFTTYRSQEFGKEGYDYNKVKKRLLEKSEALENVDKPNFVFKNNRDLTFSDESKPWGLAEKGFSNGAVFADLDNDGDLDLVNNNLNAKAFVFRNNGNALLENHYLNLKLTGHFSQGAKIAISHNGKRQFIEHSLYRGFQSTQEDLVHFGLGKDTLVGVLEIQWPDGSYQKLTNIRANQRLVVEYKNALEKTGGLGFFKDTISKAPVFTDITAKSGIDFTHQEDAFEDFNLEPLLPHRFSRNGPYLASGDVDGNGLEDFWMGGAARIAGKLFLQQKGGRFTAKDMPDPGFEDAEGLLFDADGDRDLDLHVVSGGNEYNPLTATYQDRLYFNDGKGNFELNPAALPVEYASGSCVKACDFDRDGDLDLFVGGRVVPTQYPLPAQSFILQNNGKGQFTDITEIVSPGLAKPGMVTTALWSDFDDDGWPDLIVTGEFMPVVFFKNGKGKSLVPTASGTQTGFYFSLAAGDFDRDGDTDYLAGNLGLNSKFKVSEKEPLSVYAKDLDNNGRLETIMSYFVNGSECTVASRDALAMQYPAIKGKFNDYTSFANASFDQVLPLAQRTDALVLKATGFASVYMENKGNGKFTTRQLPVQAQFSTVQAMAVRDFDRDGNLDVLAAGNFYSPDFMTGRYDASIGLLLKGNGKGGFRPLPARQSGVHLSGDVRSLAPLKLNGQPVWVVGTNSAKLRVLAPR